MENNQQSKDQQKSKSQDNTYTPGETKFADGEGTNLDKQTEDQDHLKDEHSKGSKNEKTSEGKAKFENPDDDPA
ncbi:hypothetical protein [Pedobacter sp. MC2016-24]|uniref:hypothetical protein n=1 Tax=Pedobacter sp. MC2016-24 TaxID=2780090 RepID=UPI001881A412|nr:hypothetical protein [Pedobacter sp. MC2016-24]MBE9597728.1 hypothetical protein [Pedobacter sp. MC2016-24]